MKKMNRSVPAEMKHHSDLGKFVISIYFMSTCIESVFSFSTDKGKDVFVFLFVSGREERKEKKQVKVKI